MNWVWRKVQERQKGQQERVWVKMKMVDMRSNGWIWNLTMF